MLARTTNQPTVSALVAESTDSDTDNDAPVLSRTPPRRNAITTLHQPVMVAHEHLQTLSTEGQEAAQTAPRDAWEALQRQYATFHAEQNEIQREQHGRRQDEERREEPWRDFEDGN